jgi:hypothetical protein
VLIVHRYWTGPDDPGPAAARNLVALRAYHRDVRDWTDTTLPGHVLELADRLADRASAEPRQAYRHRSNVVRLALLLELGGWWADHDLTPLCSFRSLPSPATAAHGTRCTSWLAFPAGHPRLAEALAAIEAQAPDPTRASPGASGEHLLDRLEWPDTEVARLQLPLDAGGRPVPGGRAWAVHAYRGGS